MGEIFRIEYPTRAARLDREFDRVKAGEMFDRELRIAAERYPVIEILHPLVVEIDGRHHRTEGHGDCPEDNQDTAVTADDNIREAFHEALHAGAVALIFAHAQW